MTGIVARSPDTSEIIRSILDWAVQLLEADGGEIQLYDPQDDRLTMAVATGVMEHLLGQTLKPGEGLAGRVFVAEQPLVVDDYGTWEGRPSSMVDYPPSHSELGVPLRWQERTIGVLIVVTDTTKRRFGQRDVPAVGLCANIVAAAIGNARLYQELQSSLRKLRGSLQQEIAERRAELARRAMLLESGAGSGEEGDSGLSFDELLVRVMGLRIAGEVLTGVSTAPADEPSLASLSRRELEVLALLADGYSNKSIARELVLSVNTVKAHIARILDKLRVSDRTQAALWGARHGLTRAARSQS